MVAAALLSFEQVKQWANRAVASGAPAGESRRAASFAPDAPGKLTGRLLGAMRCSFGRTAIIDAICRRVRTTSTRHLAGWSAGPARSARAVACWTSRAAADGTCAI